MLLLSLVNTSSVALATTLGDGQGQRAVKDWGDQFITKAELQDKAGQAKESFGMFDEMVANWSFKIPAGTEIQPGDTMTVKVPEVLGFQNVIKFDISDGLGHTVGKAVADPATGEVVITFTDFVANAQTTNISGSFNLSVHRDRTKVKYDTDTPVNWGTIGESTVKIEPGTDRPADDEGVKKWGYIDAEDPFLIHWTARINFSENLDTTIKNAVYHDELGPNQELVNGSISGFYVSGWEDNWYARAGASVPDSMISMTDAHHFKVSFGDLTGSVYINYLSRITDDDTSGKYDNQGSLAGENFSKTVESYVQIDGGGGNSATNIPVAGVKTWRDNDNAVGMRPESIMLELYQNDVKIATQKVTASTD